MMGAFGLAHSLPTAFCSDRGDDILGQAEFWIDAIRSDTIPEEN